MVLVLWTLLTLPLLMCKCMKKESKREKERRDRGGREIKGDR
jgi:hypothetical protein